MMRKSNRFYLPGALLFAVVFAACSCQWDGIIYLERRPEENSTDTGTDFTIETDSRTETSYTTNTESNTNTGTEIEYKTEIDTNTDSATYKNGTCQFHCVENHVCNSLNGMAYPDMMCAGGDTYICCDIHLDLDTDTDTVVDTSDGVPCHFHCLDNEICTTLDGMIYPNMTCPQGMANTVCCDATFPVDTDGMPECEYECMSPSHCIQGEDIFHVEQTCESPLMLCCEKKIVG